RLRPARDRRRGIPPPRKRRGRQTRGRWRQSLQGARYGADRAPRARSGGREAAAGADRTGPSRARRPRSGARARRGPPCRPRRREPPSNDSGSTPRSLHRRRDLRRAPRRVRNLRRPARLAAVTKLSAQEVADLVPSSLEDVRRLEDLGILEPADEDARHPSSDVHVVRLMAGFEDAGISLEDVARGIRTGGLSFPMGLFMPEPVGLPETYEQLAATLGRKPDLVRRLSRELGLPPHADDRLRAEDAEHMALILNTLDLADDEELSRFTRLYGGTVQRLVTSGLQFFDGGVRPRVATFDLPDAEKDALVYQRAAGYTELVQRLVSWLPRRHPEHAVPQILVAVAEGFMEERGITPRQPKQPPAIAFLDLTGYTRLAEERGDEAAAELASDLASVVQDTATTHGGRPVKWLGDGVMFHFNDPGGAIRSGLEL